MTAKQTTLQNSISAPSFGYQLYNWFRIAITFLIMTIGCLAMLLVALVTGFQARRFYSEKMARHLGLMVLWVWGVRLRIHKPYEGPAGQVVYISNHTSSLDVFALISLGLPNSRFFLSGFLRRYIPMGIMGYLIGIFYTCPQSQPEKRKKIFQRAHRILKKTKESVYLSPEGRVVTNGEIGHFNKGSFHLATSLQAPLVPFFIKIPEEMNFGREWRIGSGTADIYFEPPIPTRDWKLEDLEQNRDTVRNLFIELNQKYRG